MSEADNVRVWDGASGGHSEVWYLTFNDRPSGTGFWIRYTMEAPQAGHGESYAQLWFAFFDSKDPIRTFGINRKFPIGAMRAESSPFRVSIDDSVLTHDSARGAIEGNGHSARWDLSWEPSLTSHHHLPDVAYRRRGLAETVVLSPSLDVGLCGTLEVDGRTFELRGEPGCQTHLWGRKHPYSRAWGHCNAFEGRPGAAFEALSVRLRRGGVVLPTVTLLCLYLDGKALRFTGLRNVPFTRGEYGTGFYRFAARGARVRLEGEFSCHPDQMLVASMMDPDGEPWWCSNTEVGDLRITVFERSGSLGSWRERARLVAPKSAHFEATGRERDPQVTKDHVTVE